MRWVKEHNQWLAKEMSNHLIDSAYVQALVSPELLLEKITQALDQYLNTEKEIEQEVRDMLDQLERTEGNTFNRRTMYGLLKQKLAEKKGIVL